VLASRRHNTVCATFNMLRSDFAPTCSNHDRGRTWTSINEPARSRSGVDDAEDHGSEHSVRRNGTRRIRHARRWSDVAPVTLDCRPSPCATSRSSAGRTVVLGTFGRGLCDRRLFRCARIDRPSAEAWYCHLVARSTQAFQRAGLSNGLFTGENPPTGALLSHAWPAPTVLKSCCSSKMRAERRSSR
jgi:hypothetical protein